MSKSKWIEPFPDTVAIFDGVIAGAELDRNVTIKILADIKAKEVYTIHKSSPLVKYETDNDVYIFVNDVIFSQLEEWQQVLIAEEAITGIVFNSEKDKLEIKKGDVGITKKNGAFSGMISKYGYERYNVIEESIKTLYNVEKEKQAQEEEA